MTKLRPMESMKTENRNYGIHTTESIVVRFEKENQNVRLKRLAKFKNDLKN